MNDVNKPISNCAQMLMYLILIAAFTIRLINVWYGYPLPVHPDEPYVVETALRINMTGDLNPHRFFYPSLVIYLQAVLFYIITLSAKLLGISRWPSQVIDYYICGRILSVVLSILTIFVVYKIGRRLFNVRTAIIAVCFISASSLHVTNSFYATVDTSTAFWSSMACLMAVGIYTKGTKRWFYISGGICVGLATGSKYTAFLAYLPILVAHIYHARLDKKWFSKDFVLSLVCVPVVYLITTPYAVLDISTFINFIIFQHNQYLSHAGAESTTNTSLIPYFNHLFVEGYGILPTLLAITGAIYMFIENRFKAFLLLVFPVTLFILLGLYKVFFERNLMPIIPFLSLFSSYSLNQAAELIEKRISRLGYSKDYKIAVSSLVVLITLASLYNQIKIDYTMTRENTLPDTRWVSLQWIQGNLPSGATIGREGYTPPIERYSDKYRVANLGITGLFIYRNLIPSLDFMIVSDADYSRFVNNANRYSTEAQIYNNFFSDNELIKEFMSDGKTMSGPTIRIYKIKK